MITTPQKLFSEWKLKEVFELYGLGERLNFSRFDRFECRREPADSYISDLIASLKEAYLSTPFSQFTEATKSMYTWIFLCKSVAVFNSTSNQMIFNITLQGLI